MQQWDTVLPTQSTGAVCYRSSATTADRQAPVQFKGAPGVVKGSVRMPSSAVDARAPS